MTVSGPQTPCARDWLALGPHRPRLGLGYAVWLPGALRAAGGSRRLGIWVGTTWPEAGLWVEGHAGLRLRIALIGLGFHLLTSPLAEKWRGGFRNFLGSFRLKKISAFFSGNIFFHSWWAG